MTDWFNDLNVAPSGGEAPQQRDWFTEVNGNASAPSQKKQAPANTQGWGEWAAGLPMKAYKAAVGTHDPAYKDVPAFDNTPNSVQQNNLFLPMVAGADDAAYGDIIKKNLGDKFIRRFKDANGYDLIEHRGEDGKPITSYVNKPGLDSSDVTRGVLGAIPYVAGGSWLAAAKGPTLIKSLAQGGTAGMTSIAGDLTNKALGSEQNPADLAKAGWAAVGGAGGELLAPAVGALWRRFVTVPGLVDGTGQLTAKGRDAAIKAGLDPDNVSGQMAKEFAKTYAQSGSQAMAGVAAETKSFGLPTTLGQRTKDPQQLLKEKAYRQGVYGEEAKRTMQAFDEEQALQIDRMVRGTQARPSSSPSEPGMIEKLSPNKPFMNTSPSSLGDEIRSGVVAARDAAKAGEKEAWKEVPDLVPRQEAFSDLAPLITNKLGGQRLSTSTPQAMRMDEALADYAAGKTVASGTKLVNQSPIQTVDDMRRHLKDIMMSADPNHRADVAAATKIYDGFNEWVAESAKKSLLNGDLTKAAQLAVARDVTKQMHQIFSPTGAGFKPNGATRIMKEVVEKGDTPERIISVLFSNQTKSTVKDGAVQALQSIKTGLYKYTPQEADDVWNAVRVSHWSRLVEAPDGKLLSPVMMAKNIDAALGSQRSVMHALYSTGELVEMHKITRALRQVSWKDPNPSGTATALAGLTKEFMGVLMRAIPSKAVMALEMTGVPRRVMGGVGTVGARNAVSQVIPTVTNPNTSTVGAVGANALYGERQ